MEDNKSSGLWKWLVGLLVVCNMALIAIIWFKPQPQFPQHMDHHGMDEGPGGRHPHFNFDKELNFTKEQKEKFTAMTAAQHVIIDSLKKQAKATREQFFSSLSAPHADAAQLEQLSTTLGNYHKLIELQTYKHFSEVRAMLTDQQKVIFDKLIQDVLTRLPEQPHFKGDGLGPEGRYHEQSETEPEEQEEHQGEHQGHEGKREGDRDDD